MKSYIPAKLADFALWIANFSTELTGDPTDYNLTAPDAVIVDGVWDTFKAAYALSTTPATRTPVSVASTDAARASAESVIRPYAVLISSNPNVDPSMKVNIGVTVRSGTRTPVPAPNVAPIFTLKSATPMQMECEYSVAGQVGKAKPDGSVSVEIVAAVGTVAATDPSQCQGVGLYNKSPLFVTFTSGEQGKIATMFARFITRSGPAGVSQFGPWSAPLTNHIV
jgi:hypothetical protein